VVVVSVITFDLGSRVSVEHLEVHKLTLKDSE